MQKVIAQMKNVIILCKGNDVLDIDTNTFRLQN